MRRMYMILPAVLALSGTAVIGQSPPSASTADVFADRIIWDIDLGIHQYSSPLVREGRVFVGADDRALSHPAVKPTGGGLVLCLDEATGARIWQLPVPRYMEGTKPPFHFNHWKSGICSTPAFDEQHLFIVGSRGEVLCLDPEGQADGNEGPFRTEVEYMGIPASAGYELSDGDGDIVWAYNMITELGVVPHDVCGSSPLLYGNHLYVCTSNGQDDKHDDIANPDAPSLIVLDKNSGKLLATDGGLFGDRLFHGNWSSPVLGTFAGRDHILFSGGDGILYAFEPISPDTTPKTVQDLAVIWSYDCNPADYRFRDGEPVPVSKWNTKRADGPSELIASPAIHQGRIYVGIGQSPIHGPGQGIISCIDGTTGAKVWENRTVGRTLATVEIHEGLCYVPDLTGRLHCLDADTGETVWTHDLGDETWTCSARVIGDQVYVGTTKRKLLYVFQTGPEKLLIHRSRLKGATITPTLQNGVLYLPTQRNLLALRP